MAESPPMTLSRDTILAFLRSHWVTLRAMGVTQIGLFGSYSRDEQHPRSDIDLLFRMDNMTFTRWMDVWNYLEDGVEVDLVPEQDLREEIRPQVLAEVVYVADN
ncbi:MAG: nucleotidyltransferase family protein [Anaerolineae bacterium]|nr:nucleotidyltransferase family protein [Anaerolineae bacterium]